MPLESLLQLVETLRERISAHRAVLSQSEALTRYALIDPLLRELGWDTEDPSMVVPEYRVPNNQIADYVLFHGDHPAMVVESKKLDECRYRVAELWTKGYCTAPTQARATFS